MSLLGVQWPKPNERWKWNQILLDVEIKIAKINEVTQMSTCRHTINLPSKGFLVFPRFCQQRYTNFTGQKYKEI